MANTFRFGFINATYMHDLKSLVYNHKQVLSTTKLQTFIEKIHSPGDLWPWEEKMATSAITLAISGNCELY